MAEGDKVVPSGGNPQLDPTAKGALNSTLGRTSGALNSSLGTTQGSLTNDKTRSGSLSSANWVRNQNGQLVHVNEVERDVARQESMRRNSKGSKSWVLSESDILNRGKEEYGKSLRAFGSKKPEKSGSPDGESTTPTATEFQKKQSEGKQPIQRNRVNVFAGAFGQLAFGSPVFRQAASMAIAAFPLQTLVPKCVGPFMVQPTNHDGAVPQSNANESATKGQNVNSSDTETPPDGL